MASENLSIGDLAKATNTKVVTIRYYEKIGLLPAPDRTAGNYRSYSATHLGRLSFIRRARDLGFSIEQVRDLLGLRSEEHTSELQSLMRISYAGFCFKQKNSIQTQQIHTTTN